MHRLLYTGVLYFMTPLALSVTALRGLRDPAYRDRLTERLGFTHVRFARAPIWVHAVSVGEVQAAAVLIRALQNRCPGEPLLVTTATPTGAQRVAALFGEGVRHAYLPYDTPGAVQRFLERTGPRIAIVMEREIWPNLFRECRRRKVPIVLASARMSASSAERHRKFIGLFGPALARNVTIAAQTQADAERYVIAGADRATTHVTGNIKFDLDVSEATLQAGKELRSTQFPSRRVWTAGSTHEGEETVVLDAHRRIGELHENALLILAPRHPQRFEQVAALLRARSIPFVTRSSQQPVTAQTQVLLADTLGELVMLFAAADVAFVGGSLVAIGGHNLLEPAALARPIVTGPHNFNAQDIARMFLHAGAAIEVRSSEQLAEQVSSLFADSARREEMGARGRAIVDGNRGALERVLELVQKRLARSSHRDRE